jgi:hypothetical protein
MTTEDTEENNTEDAEEKPGENLSFTVGAPPSARLSRQECRSYSVYVMTEVFPSVYL